MSCRAHRSGGRLPSPSVVTGRVSELAEALGRMNKKEESEMSHTNPLPDLPELTDDEIRRIAETLPKRHDEDFPSWGHGYRVDEAGEYRIPTLPNNILPFARALLAAQREAYDLGARSTAPIDMVLHCPACGLKHIDAPDTRRVLAEGVYVDDVTLWDNPPHKSHLCHGCGHIWRPADVPTNGVEHTKTIGKNDSIPAGVLAARSTAAQPVEPTGLKLVPIELTGAMWSAGRHEFTAQAQRWKHAPTSDAASVVADVAPGEIHRAMLAAAPPAASGDSTPPSAPVQGDPSGALRPEPEAVGQGTLWRKKPVVVEAWLIGLDNPKPGWVVDAFAAEGESGLGTADWCPSGDGSIWVDTLEGVMTAKSGDWLIRGIKGELYPCKPDIFAAAYEPAEPPQGASGERGD